MTATAPAAAELTRSPGHEPSRRRQREARSAPPPTRPIAIVLLALSFAGGAVDAGTFLGLGHVFPANMTGNTVLLMIAVVVGGGTELARAAVALGAYAVGVALGTAVLCGSAWPRSAHRTLLIEASVLAALIGSWAAFGPGAHFGLIAAAAVAMGAQSAAVRASHVGGVSTTYVTGTLTTAIARAVGRLQGRVEESPPSPRLPGGAWLVYGVGALAGGVAERAWHAGVMAIPLGLVATSAVAALVRRPGEER